MSRARDAEVRVAVVGCGAIAQAVHLPTLEQLPGVRVVAVIDPSAEARQAATALAPLARAHASLADALAAEAAGDVADAVVVCTPIPLLAKLAAAAFAASRHVYVEKPLATEAPAALALHDAWRSSGRIGVAGFNYRRHPLLQEARRLLRDGAIGEVVGVQGIFTSRPSELPAWKQEPSGGTVLFDLAPHHIDLVTWLLDEAPTAVAAHLTQRRYPGDTATISCRFAGGTILQGTYSYDAVPDDQLILTGTTGRLSIDRISGLGVELTRGPRERTTWQRVRSAARLLRRDRFARVRLLRPDAEPSFRLAMSGFVDSVRHWPGTPTSSPNGLVTIEEGLRCLEVLFAARTAAANGCWEPVRPLVSWTA